MPATRSPMDPLHDIKALPPVGERPRARELAAIAEQAVAAGYKVDRATAATVRAAAEAVNAKRAADGKRHVRSRNRKRAA